MYADLLGQCVQKRRLHVCDVRRRERGKVTFTRECVVKQEEHLRTLQVGLQRITLASD